MKKTSMITSSIASVGIKTIRDSLTKDFCIALSTQIILWNVEKCHLNLADLDRDGYIRLIDSIISDYTTIKPLGNDISNLKKREWLAAVDIIDWSLSCKSELQLT